MDSEAVRQRVRVERRTHRRHESADSPAVQIVKHVPEQADIDTGTGRNRHQLHKLLFQRYPVLIIQRKWQFTEHIDKKQLAAKATTPKASVDSSRTAVDQLLDRLEVVTDRIDTLEKRLAELENSNAPDSA